MLRHVVLELVHPLALVATVRAEVFSLLLVDPHVVLGRGQEGRVRVRPCPLPWERAGLWDTSEGLKDSSDIPNCMGQGGLSAYLADYKQGDLQWGQDQNPVLLSLLCTSLCMDQASLPNLVFRAKPGLTPSPTELALI